MLVLSAYFKGFEKQLQKLRKHRFSINGKQASLAPFPIAYSTFSDAEIYAFPFLEAAGCWRFARPENRFRPRNG